MHTTSVKVARARKGSNRLGSIVGYITPNGLYPTFTFINRSEESGLVEMEHQLKSTDATRPGLDWVNARPVLLTIVVSSDGPQMMLLDIRSGQESFSEIGEILPVIGPRGANTRRDVNKWAGTTLLEYRVDPPQEVVKPVVSHATVKTVTRVDKKYLQNKLASLKK